MDATSYWLDIFILCFSLPMIFFSMRKIIRESKHNRESLPPGNPRPHWYTNFVIRQEVGNVFFMIMLLLIISGLNFTLLNRALLAPSGFWLLFSFCSLNAICRIYIAFSEEYERHRIAREAGETPGRWLASFKFHRGLAYASFWVGIPMPFILTRWDAVNSHSSNPMDIYLWLEWIFVGISGLYWLGTYTLEFFQAYRRGGWAAVEQTIVKARQPLSSQVVNGDGQQQD